MSLAEKVQNQENSQLQNAVLEKRRPFNILHNAGLVVIHYFSFFFSGKLIICPLILNEGYAGWLWVLAFHHFEYFLPIPLSLQNCFSLAIFKILSLSVTFGILIMMCLSWASLGSSCLRVLPGLVCVFPSTS